MPFAPRVSALLDGRDDDAVWNELGETWCIMATDLSGFSRGVAEHGIIHFLRIIQDSERLLVPVIAQHGGTLLKVEGDSLLAIFADAHAGLDAAVAMQRATRAWNASRPGHEHVLVGIGLGYGRVIRVAEADVYGSEVNSACILGETHAQAYEILVTQAVRDQAGDRRFDAIETVPPGAGGAYRVSYA